MSQLLPDGITHLGDAPFTLHEAILTGLRVLSYYDNLTDDERPPRTIWLENEKLSAWFKEVERKRKEKYGIADDDDDASSGEYETNEAAAGLIARG